MNNSTSAMIPRRAVERAILRFSDLADEVAAASAAIWPDALRRFLSLCDSDPVMQEIMRPLNTVSVEEARDWIEEMCRRPQAEPPGYELTLSEEDAAKLAILFTVCRLIACSRPRLRSFGVRALRARSAPDAITAFNQQVFCPFARGVGRLLAGLLEATEGQDGIPTRLLSITRYSTTSHITTPAAQGQVTDVSGTPQIRHREPGRAPAAADEFEH